MRYRVKPGCSFFVDFVKKVEGDIVGPYSAKTLKRYMHLVEPFDDGDEVEAPAEAPAPAKPVNAAAEGDDAPAEKPKTTRRRRAKVDG